MPDPATLRYRVDWWIPLESSPGEWAGGWAVAGTPEDARVRALSIVDEEGQSCGLVLITLETDGGERRARVVADAAALRSWRSGESILPESGIDPEALPPIGREDVETMALARCRAALHAVRDAGLIEAALVGAVLYGIQQAFAGVGPFVDLLELTDGRASPRGLT